MRLDRELYALAGIAGAALTALGVVAGIAIDVLIHRHRRPRS